MKKNTENTNAVSTELAKAVSSIEEKANGICVNSDEEMEFANEFLHGIKDTQKKVTGFWEPLRKSTYEAYKAVCDKKGAMLKPLEAAEKAVKDKISEYGIRLKREAEERELQARIAAKIEADKKLAEAVEAYNNGDELGSEIATMEAEAMDNYSNSAIAVGTKVNADGLTMRKNWKITSIDEKLVPIELAGIELRHVDEKAILKLIKMCNGNIHIDGVTFEEDYTVAVR